MTFALAIVGLSLLIILHELGHYWAARVFGIRVLRFSVGFGPTLISHTWKETEWQLAMLPFGGFVQVDGMDPDDDDPGEDPSKYRNKPAWQRAIFVLAGPAMNWFLAVALVAGLGLTTGILTPSTAPAIGLVANDSPAEKAGLTTGDEIIRVDGEPVLNWSELVTQIVAHKDREMPLVVRRNEELIRITAIPLNGRLGIGPVYRRIRHGPAESLGAGLQYAWHGSGQLVGLLWGMLDGSKEGRLGGLPSIVEELSSSAREGFDRLVQTLAWLSVTLCVLNLLPLPAVDGGRLMFIAIETIRGRPAPERVEAMVHSVGMMLLLLLAMFLFVRDLF